MIFPLAGNDGIKEAVFKAFNTSRLPHALIIEGESGSGKTILSDFIISAFLCEEAEKPCGSCKSCRMLKAGTHPDVIYVAPAEGKKNISIDQIRNMRNEVYIRPQFSNRKVFNIDYADTLNQQCQNTILKVLEEPPGDVLFILQVRSRASFLPTILSRCVTYTLSEPELNVSAKYISETRGIGENEAIELLEQNGLQIGNVLHCLDSKKKDITYQTAVNYLETCNNGLAYELMVLTVPFERDRVKADAFFSHLSYLLLCSIKEKTVKKEDTAKEYERYEQVLKAKEFLQSNINLPLLFSKFAAEFI